MDWEARVGLTLVCCGLIAVFYVTPFKEDPDHVRCARLLRCRLIPASVGGILAWLYMTLNGDDPNNFGSALFSIFIGLWTT